MLKKTLFLSLALGLISNSAFATCYNADTEESAAYKGLAGFNSIASAATTAPRNYVNYSPRGLKVANGLSNGFFAAGLSSSGMSTLELLECKSILLILKDAKIGKGLGLEKITAEINEELTGATKVQTKNVASVLNNLSDQNILQENNISTYSDLKALVIFALTN